MLALLVQDPHNPKCLIVDAVACFTHQDISVMSMVGELHKELRRRGIHMVMAGRHGQMTQWLKQAGIRIGEEGHPQSRHVSGPAHDPLLPGAGVQG